MQTIFDRPYAVKYMSHCGFQPLAPENSLPSFEYAGLLGQWAIETDVHVTCDGRLVCCHDERVERTFAGEGRIEEMTWAELSALRMNRGNRLECFEAEQLRMPLFSEYLSICRRFGSVPFIELKTPDAERVLRAVREAGLTDRDVVMSAIPLEWVLETRRVSKEAYIHWIFADEARLGELAEAGNAGLSLNIPDPFDCSPEKVAQIHAMGLRMCLRAGDTARTAARMHEIGLDYVPTNCMHLPVEAGMSLRTDR